MASLFHTLWNALTGKQHTASSHDEAEAEQLRQRYKHRCAQFRHLLASNKTALEIMSDMEEAQRGLRPFGMNYVRGSCTRVSTSVYQMVKSLNVLTDNRYTALYPQCRQIQKQIEQELILPEVTSSNEFVLPLDAVRVDMADSVGNKMANLGELRYRLGETIPDGFVVTSHGFRFFLEQNNLQEEIDRRIQATDINELDSLFRLSSIIQQLILHAPIPEPLREAITKEVTRLEHAGSQASELRLALRSSAIGEDSAGASFAGQYRSELNICPEHVLETWREIVASKYSVTAMTYRYNRGILDETVAMCVGALVMVDAKAGGVAYSRNPLDLRDNTTIINAAIGLPKAVVDGSWTPDVYTLHRTPEIRLLHSEIAQKPSQFLSDGVEGIALFALSPEEGAAPSITEAQALTVGKLAVSLEEHYGEPQDIEWAIDTQDRVIILQTRPLKKLQHSLDASEEPAPTTDEVSDNTSDDALVLFHGGTPVSLGIGSGHVYCARTEADMLRFPQGAVLVVERALPRWATLLSRASALVAEQGGTAGHLASVAREYGVPALFGVNDALTRLQEAGEITVDADNRRIHKGLIVYSESRRKRPAPMEGSPVLQHLRNVAEHIIPLHLLDPDAPTFVPEQCTTLHDITRFCHEKSVEALFQAEEGTPEALRAGKQLQAGSKLQYWIIDMEDGFIHPVTGATVDISNIASLPMLQLWDGMTAVPWKGPPALSGSGFMSVMFESTVNPELESSLATSLANKNFFMISKNFCHLQARFGYHFCTVEIHADKKDESNYVSFHFKGGAANLARRIKRTKLIQKLLEEEGFSVDSREDALFATYEHLPKDEALQLARILGYIIIHTRQIDMIMDNTEQSETLKERFHNDMAALRQRPFLLPTKKKKGHSL